MSNSYRLYINDAIGAEIGIYGVKVLDNQNAVIDVNGGAFDTRLADGTVTSGLGANSYWQTASGVAMLDFQTTLPQDIFKIAFLPSQDYSNAAFSLRRFNADGSLSAINQITIPHLTANVEQIVVVKVDNHVTLPSEIDKTRLPKVKAAINGGSHPEMLDVFALILGKTSLAVTALNVLIDNGGYTELVAAHVSKSSATKLLAIYNVAVNGDRIAIDAIAARIKTEFAVLAAFNSWLTANGVAVVNPSRFDRLYSDMAVHLNLLPFSRDFTG